MSLTRRSFIKQTAAATAASAAGVTLPVLAAGVNMTIAAVADAEVTWSKAPCRFCGTGCGVTVGVKAGRVVATQGDPLAEVNRGLNCVKGYFLSKIMYGADRLTTPLLRMKDGKYAKDGEFTPVSWDQAFSTMAEQFKRVLKEKGPTAVGMFGSGQWTVFEGYAAVKLMKAGFRSNNLDPNARHCMKPVTADAMLTALAGRIGEQRGPWIPRFFHVPRGFYGMLVAHFGIGVFIAGVTLVKGYEAAGDARLDIGQSIEAGGYTFRFDGAKPADGPNYRALRANIVVSREGRVIAVMHPEKRFFVVQKTTMTEAAVDRGVFRDLYVALGDAADNSTTAWTVRVQIKPFVDWIWAGCC